MDPSSQVALLAAAGASESQIKELLQYNESTFTPTDSELDSTSAAVLPLPDEPMVECWTAWAEEVREDDVFTVLARYLPQFSFPIREGISQSEAYRAATLRGDAVADFDEATGLELERPDLIELELHPSLAGRIPVLTVRWRPDFVSLVRVLAKRNEPVDVPEAQGAVMVGGFNNWERIRQLQRRWQARDPEERERSTWSEEFAHIRPQKELYQDRFIILCDHPYSAVPAADLGLEDEEWRQLSLMIRREHESTHYFTRRFYGSMRNHLLDELIADYAGLVAASGRFRADWFLRFLGLEEYPRYRSGGRLELYRDDPPLTDGAFAVLHRLVVEAAAHVERFDARWPEGPRALEERGLAIRALASLSFLELTTPEAVDRLEDFCA